MKKVLPLLLFGVLATFNACQKNNPSPVLSREIPTATDNTELDRFIREKVENEGQFLWSWASNDQIWTALNNSDFVLSVGFQPEGFTDLDARIHEIDLQAENWLSARRQVVDLILESEQKQTPGLRTEDIMSYEVLGIPAINVRVTNPETIGRLRASALVRYAEPIGYEPFMKEIRERSTSGCGGNNAEPGLAVSTDYNNILPGCKQSWNHSFHNITGAWNNSTGSGSDIVIIDTGSSDDQNNLNEEFNQGYSNYRYISRLVTLPQTTNFWGSPTGSPETPHDPCGHGTSMAGACAAPRGEDGAATGIAYGANLTVYRAAVDVFLDESREVTGVSNAFTQSGNNGSVRIISMSMGRITSSSQISDAIKYAYNKGKMIFCAAGTSFSWTAWFTGVIFPASMTQAIAVTGIKDNLTNRCNACHQGSKVDFVMVMEKNSNGRTPLSLDQISDDPSTVGGSSVATASVAGIAGLVWSKYPSWTRTQVFDRLKTSSNYFPSRNSNFGWGRINAQLATQ